MPVLESYSVTSHFTGKDPSIRKLYDRLISILRKFGPIREEAKKTSIHLVNRTALAGVEVRKTGLVLNVKANHRIKSPRIEKTEQISAGRFHHIVKLTSPKDLDKDLRGWLKEAYKLSG